MNSTKVKQRGNFKKPKSKAKSTAKKTPQVKKRTTVKAVKKAEPIERWDWWNIPGEYERRVQLETIKVQKQFDDMVEAARERNRLQEAGLPVPISEHDLIKFLAHHQQ